MKATKKSVNGTSFFGTEVQETPRNMIKFFGEPHCLASDKTNMEWMMETEDGTVFTIYDWKNYGGIGMDQLVDWHIGGFSEDDTKKAREEIVSHLFNNS